VENGLIGLVFANRTQRYTNCSFQNASFDDAIAGIMIPYGGGGGRVIFDNTTVKLGTAQQSIMIGGTSHLVWRNTVNAISSYSGFQLGNAPFTAGGHLFAEGVDFAGPDLTARLIQHVAGAGALVTLKDCKLSSVGAPALRIVDDIPDTVSTGSLDVQIVRCDSGDTNYRIERWNWFGTQFTDPEVTRSSGASDGTTRVSWRIESKTTRWGNHYESLPIPMWNETIGVPITLTIHGTWDGMAPPNDDDIWIEAQYLGTSGYPLSAKATSTKANGLAVGTAYPSGSGGWSGGAASFVMRATLIPQEKGPITIYICVAKPSATFYVDPKPMVT
jgi:hypothetical protein